MAINLPGYYYDEERGRYFKVVNNERSGAPTTSTTKNQYNREEIKRRKFRETQQKKYEFVVAERTSIYMDHIRNIQDPLYLATEGKKTQQIIAGLRLQSRYLRLEELFNKNNTVSITPVSYTHLDVYKRQVGI